MVPKKGSSNYHCLRQNNTNYLVFMILSIDDDQMMRFCRNSVFHKLLKNFFLKKTKFFREKNRKLSVTDSESKNWTKTHHYDRQFVLRLESHKNEQFEELRCHLDKNVLQILQFYLWFDFC